MFWRLPEHSDFKLGSLLSFGGVCYHIYLIINRLFSSVLQSISPFEALHNHSPSLDHMRVFGCLGYVTQVRKVDKFSPKASPDVFLGYSSTQKGYIIYDLSTKVFCVSRDVTFKKEVFSFHHWPTTVPHLFSVLDKKKLPLLMPISLQQLLPTLSTVYYLLMLILSILQLHMSLQLLHLRLLLCSPMK